MERQFSFGFFSEEERHSFLDHPPCVEFPWRCEAKSQVSSSATHGTRPETESVWDCNSQDSNLKDENHNHVSNKANLGNSPIEPVKRTIDYKAGTVKTTQPRSSPKNENERRTDLDTTVSSEQPDIRGSSDDNHETSGSIQNNSGPVEKSTAPITNGHDDRPSLNTKDNITADRDTDGCNGHDPDGGTVKNESQRESTDEKTLDRVGNTAHDPSTVPKSVTKAPSTWASLFSGEPQAPKQGRPLPFVESAKTAPVSTPNLSVAAVTSVPKESDNAKKRPAASNGTTSNKADDSPKVVDLKDDPFSRQIAEQISRNEIVYRSPGLMPRGFINSSTWCYINATLQALLTCSPFCHLMRSFPSRHSPQDGGAVVTSTPILDSFVRLVKELKPLSKRHMQRNSKDQWHGVSHEPEYIYKMLSVIKSNLSERGRQEDAEEFLSCVLNGLHEEMLKLTDHYFGKAKPIQNGDVVHNSQTELGYEVPVHEEDPDDASTDDQEQWEEVHATRKSRSSITRRADMSKTPMSDVFRGELRSDLSQEGQRSTATLEPFFTLPLDINDLNTWSVNEALEHLTRTEMVEDFTNSKTKAKVEVTRRQTLETLPPVLILHLKRFVYDKEGGSLKLDKDIQYHTDLVISKDLLSRPSRKLPQEKRTYKLFAVVYHHGKKSTGGHYTTDVYHDGLNCWLRIDDQHIKTTNVHEVVRHNPQRTAYLLYYKRTDLMSV